MRDRIGAVRARLSETGRAQLSDLLEEAYARELQAEAQATDYNVVTLRGTGHVDLPSAWLGSLQPEQKQALGEAVQADATDRFQYLYDNHPIYDLNLTGAAPPV